MKILLGLIICLIFQGIFSESLNFAKVMGRDASEFFGPYANSDEK